VSSCLTAIVLGDPLFLSSAIWTEGSFLLRNPATVACSLVNEQAFSLVGAHFAGTTLALPGPLVSPGLSCGLLPTPPPLSESLLFFFFPLTPQTVYQPHTPTRWRAPHALSLRLPPPFVRVFPFRGTHWNGCAFFTLQSTPFLPP